MTQPTASEPQAPWPSQPSFDASTADAPTPSVITLSGIHRRYADTAAVEGLNLQIARGEFFSLLGASGCGKTTTLRLIAGFEKPDAGSIHLQGIDVTHMPAHRRPVNTVFQNFALFPHLNVWDNVAFGPRSQRLPAIELRRRVGEALDIVRLSDLARRRPHQLSGGQQQRVALARALVNRPAALLLDEPLAALDPNLRRAMQLELKRIQRDVSITFLFVTHDREEALALSDRLAVMHAGRLAQVGTPSHLYDSPANAYVASFLGSANLIPHHDGWRLLRPERLKLSLLPPKPPLLGIQARLQAITFQGPTLEVRLRHADPYWIAAAGAERMGGVHFADNNADDTGLGAEGPELVAIAIRESLEAVLHPGQLLWCHWDPADTHPLGAG